VLEHGAAIQTNTGNAHNGELNGQHVPFLPGWKVAGGVVSRTHEGIGKGLGIELRRFYFVALVLNANRVLRWLRHRDFLFFARGFMRENARNNFSHGHSTCPPARCTRLAILFERRVESPDHRIEIEANE
jgi:hypothetical protein